MIEPTPEMEQAFRDAWVKSMATNPRTDDPERIADRAGLAAVLAIVERDRSDAAGLERGANAARRIADRYGEKGKDRTRNDWQMWTAMSAGARAVAVRLTELADAEDSP